MNGLVRMLAVIACFALLTMPCIAADKVTIQKNVDDMVAAINDGTAAASYTADAYTPYVFVMATNGKLIVHPYLTGEYLQEKAAPVYAALQKATREGVWVTYFWKGVEKETYVRKTNGDLTVGSGQ
jgi:hypothetical protein